MPVTHGFKPQPLVNAGKQPRQIDPSSLSKERKRLLWAGIKTLEPALAELLQLDAEFDELKKQLNASVRFSQADFDRFTQAGRLVIGEKENV